jgi:hypothetical protein
MNKIYEWCDKHEEEMAVNEDSQPQQQTTQALPQPHQETNTMDTGNIQAVLQAHQAAAPATGSAASSSLNPSAAPVVRRTQVHTIVMPTTPPTSFEVIEYKVSAQPVAFHHPLHWFLADLLENVDFLDSRELQKVGFQDFRRMMLQFVGNEQDSEEKREFKLQEIFDYPLRGMSFFFSPYFFPPIGYCPMIPVFTSLLLLY